MNIFGHYRDSLQLALVEGLRMLGISTVDYREPAPNTRSLKPRHDGDKSINGQKRKHGGYGESLILPHSKAFLGSSNHILAFSIVWSCRIVAEWLRLPSKCGDVTGSNPG